MWSRRSTQRSSQAYKLFERYNKNHNSGLKLFYENTTPYKDSIDEEQTV